MSAGPLAALAPAVDAIAAMTTAQIGATLDADLADMIERAEEAEAQCRMCALTLRDEAMRRMMREAA